jgi:hypothetical protein
MKLTTATIVVLAITVTGPVSGCSGGKSTKPVQIDSGTVAGQKWSLLASHNETGELCLTIGDYSGGCGKWTSDPYVDGPGPGDSEFLYGPVRPSVTTVEATAPGHQPLTVQAHPIAGSGGKVKYFVLALPDQGTVWTCTARTASGTPERLGLS